MPSPTLGLPCRARGRATLQRSTTSGETRSAPTRKARSKTARCAAAQAPRPPTGEQRDFRADIQGVGARVSDRPVGADTVFFHKTSDEVLDTSLQDSIRVAIQDGAAFLTYLGHSAAETWEIVIDDPEDFNNEDRLPVVFSLGCRTGNFAALSDRGTLAARLELGSEAGSIAPRSSSASRARATPTPRARSGWPSRRPSAATPPRLASAACPTTP